MVDNIWEGADAQTHLLVETSHWMNCWNLIRSSVILLDDAPLIFGDHLVILSCNEVISEVRIILRARVSTGKISILRDNNSLVCIVGYKNL